MTARQLKYKILTALYFIGIIAGAAVAVIGLWLTLWICHDLGFRM